MTAEVRDESGTLTYSSEWKPEPRCPLREDVCEAKVNRKHFEEYCCQTLSSGFPMGYENCPHYEKSKRKMPRDIS